MELYLIRNGDMSGDPHKCYKPPVKECLSDVGQRQVAALGEALACNEFDAVYTSPLGRAIQTAQALSVRQGQHIQVLDWLMEWRPATIMRGCDDASYERMLTASASLAPEMSWRTEAGESTFEMGHRIIPGFLELMAGHGAAAAHGGYVLESRAEDQRLALVGHGGSLGMLAAFILGVPFRPYAPIGFAQTGVAIFQFVRRVDVWYPMLLVPAPYPQSVVAPQ
jgi:broad specificity phosphatase PhoE